MRVVLYTDDMLPITVVDVSQRLHDMLAGGMTVLLPVPWKSRRLFYEVSAAPVAPVGTETVKLYGETFIRHGKPYTFVFTRDEELALALRAAFLPGQVGEVQDREQLARVQGFLAALRAFDGHEG